MVLPIVKGRHGSFLYQKSDAYVGRSLHEYGEYSELELAIINEFIRPGDVVIEGGGNIGAITVPLARKLTNKGGLVVFEPQRLIFNMLCGNLALNEIENVAVHNAALGDAIGTTKLPVVRYGVPFNYGAMHVGWDQGETVPVRTIDSLGLRRLDFIMADVEGAEEAMLRGAANTLARFKPPLYLENNQRDKSPALLSYIFEMGYEVWWHLPPLFNPNNYFGRKDNVFKTNVVSVNIFCFHRERTGTVINARKVTSPTDWWQA